ncbi:MAG: transcriptional regulator [Oscillospiraceae bacterium]
MNKTLKKHYLTLVQFLGKALGPDYEVVLHDLEQKNDDTITAVSNNHISGREIGAPLTNKALEMIAEKTYVERDYILQYTGVSDDNHLLCSNTMFIKDDDGKLLGMLCINFDGSRYSNVCNQVLSLCYPPHFIAEHGIEFNALQKNISSETLPNAEHFPKSITEAMETTIRQVIYNYPVNEVSRLTQNEKIEIVGILNKKGIFQLKGAVSQVAEILETSEASIYRYLSKLNRQNSDEN